MSKVWDDGMLKKLKALSAKGLSTAEIGKHLNITKNAVVGKLNRLGWNIKAGGAPVADEKNTKKTAKKAKPEVKAKKEVADKKKEAPVKKSDKKTTAKETKASVKKVQDKKATVDIQKETSSKDKKTGQKNLAMHQRIIQHSLEMANLKPGQCRWPIGDPDSEDFHFCGEQVFVGKPYCYEHCKQAYQFVPPKKKQQ